MLPLAHAGLTTPAVAGPGCNEVLGLTVLRSEKFDGLHVRLSAEELLQGLGKKLRVLLSGGEQGETGPELHGVDVSEYLGSRGTLMRADGGNALSEACA